MSWFLTCPETQSIKPSSPWALSEEQFGAIWDNIEVGKKYVCYPLEAPCGPQYALIHLEVICLSCNKNAIKVIVTHSSIANKDAYRVWITAESFRKILKDEICEDKQ